MQITTLQEKISKAKIKIEKKLITISKKENWVIVKTNKLPTLSENDSYWLSCEVNHLKEDVIRLKSEVKETESILAKYEGQLTGELNKENDYLSKVPACLKELEVALIEKWNETDKKNRDYLVAKYKELGYNDFLKVYSYNQYYQKDITDEKIEKDNIQEAKYFIIDLYYRIKDITGEVTDWSEFKLLKFTLSGFISGKEGRVKIETIVAGGYNIQRLHLRVLTHSV